MKSGRYWHYWDSCIFLHWLSDPDKDAAVVDGIEDIVMSVERGEAGVMTSVVTRIEILRSRLDKKQATTLFKLFVRPGIQQINVDPRVAQLAHDIRDFYASSSPPVSIRTPDCIHLASAIIYEADEMNTLDGAGKRRRPHDLISLSENVMGGKYKLPIRKPLRKQASMLTGARPLEIAPRAAERPTQLLQRYRPRRAQMTNKPEMIEGPEAFRRFRDATKAYSRCRKLRSRSMVEHRK